MLCLFAVLIGLISQIFLIKYKPDKFPPWVKLINVAVFG